MKSVKIDLGQTATPHQDAQRLARAAIIKNFADKIARPGKAGVEARLRLAMLLAYGEAFAKELDFASKPSAIVVGFSHALGDVAASLLTSMVLRLECSDDEKWSLLQEGLERMMGRALGRGLTEADRVLRGDVGDNEYVALSYDAGPPAGNG